MSSGRLPSARDGRTAVNNAAGHNAAGHNAAGHMWIFGARTAVANPTTCRFWIKVERGGGDTLACTLLSLLMRIRIIAAGTVLALLPRWQPATLRGDLGGRTISKGQPRDTEYARRNNGPEATQTAVLKRSCKWAYRNKESVTGKSVKERGWQAFLTTMIIKSPQIKIEREIGTHRPEMMTVEKEKNKSKINSISNRNIFLILSL